MKLIAAISVDLERSPLGTRSLLGDDLLGKPVLRRTVERIRRVTTFSSIHVLCPSDQSNRVQSLLNGLDIKIETHGGSPPPYQELVRVGRLWGLDGWRGGIGGLCVFDEDFHAGLTLGLLKKTGADALMTIPAAAAVTDPVLLDEMARYYLENHETIRLNFVQAPPGLGGLIIDRALLADLAAAGMPPGSQLIYQPNNPTPDLTGRETCYRPSLEIVQATGRLLCDTRRSMNRVRRLLEAGGERWDACRISQWLSEIDAGYVERVPTEIEIELTTEDPLSGGSLLRPREKEVGDRGPISLDIIQSIANEMGDYDDVRIVLGGFGEPCCHPQFGEICRLLRDSDAASIAVRTNAVLDQPSIETVLFETPVDVVEITLDAAGPETYQTVHGRDAYSDVLNRLEHWMARREKERRVLPLIVPSLIKADVTMDDLEPFVDQWQRRTGTYLVTGYSHYAEQRRHREVTGMAPPDRTCCRQVFSRTMILADGNVTTCDQDFSGRQVIGNLLKTRLSELWQSPPLQQYRSQVCADAPLCEKCDEWHRP